MQSSIVDRHPVAANDTLVIKETLRKKTPKLAVRSSRDACIFCGITSPLLLTGGQWQSYRVQDSEIKLSFPLLQTYPEAVGSNLNNCNKIFSQIWILESNDDSHAHNFLSTLLPILCFVLPRSFLPFFLPPLESQASCSYYLQLFPSILPVMLFWPIHNDT